MPLKQRCLLIEDSVVQAKCIEIMLKYCGWETAKAFDMAQAIEIMKTQQFELVLCDLVLPDANNGEIIKVASHYAPNAQIAAMTAAGEINLKKSVLFDAKANGAEYLLNKPFTRQHFSSFIHEVEYRFKNSERLMHILVIEDSSAMRNICQNLLVETGFRVTLCDSMNMALRDIDLLDVDVIICDLNMPGIDPKSAIPLIRDSIPDVAIIAMSGNIDSELSDMIKNGADAILGKPFKANDILRAIETALYKHDMLEAAG